MGKSRRHTAKTGDKSLYSNNRGQTSQIVQGRPSTGKNRNNDDLIYDEAEQFHKNDYLRLDHHLGDDDDDDDSDDDGMGEEEVMRLDHDEDDDDDTDGGDEDDTPEEEEDDDDDDEDEDFISSDDDEEEGDENDVRDWGMKKTAYYYGDTADLEIGQEVEEALLEEDAAKDVLNARYQDMTEDDFMMEDTAETGTAQTNGPTLVTGAATDEVNVTLPRLLQLSTREKRQWLNQKHHQEFIPLLSYFTQKMVLPYSKTTRKAANAMFHTTNNKDGTRDIENTADVRFSE